ncbi:MAG: carbamoyltransferase HypF, partial [Candidatus Aenigmarchaeota archaeon]|nr:carbamoyltransferase HypF [Candidatus Aenigmarchaeota archaeon]
PLPVDVNIKDAPDMLSFGAQEANTISVYKNGKVFVSQHIGDTSHVNVMNTLKKTVELFVKISGARPKIIACDMHPDYYTAAYARELALKTGAELVPVQHHMAHACSCAFETGLSSFGAIVCDGSGYGQDGNVWGGEVFLFKDGKKVHDARVGHLEEQILVGGESAVRNPGRALFGILSGFLEEDDLVRMFGENSAIWNRQIADNFNIQKTTSAGRILDAASAFLGFCTKRTYTGEPAMALESGANAAKPYDLEPVIEKRNSKVLKTTPLFEFLWEMRDKDKSRLASTVHDYLARGLFSIADSASRGLPIVFSGGVAYNRHITGYMLGKGALVNSKVPAGDGGISFGQIGSVLGNQD